MSRNPAKNINDFDDIDLGNLWEYATPSLFNIDGVISGAGSTLTFNLGAIDTFFKDEMELLCRVTDIVLQHTSPNPLEPTANVVYTIPSDVTERLFMAIPNGAVNQVKNISMNNNVKIENAIGEVAGAARIFLLSNTITDFKMTLPIVAPEIVLNVFPAVLTGTFTGNASLLIEVIPVKPIL